MTIEVKAGFILITDVINNKLVKEKYFFYTKKGAIKKFKQKYYAQNSKQTKGSDVSDSSIAGDSHSRIKL